MRSPALISKLARLSIPDFVRMLREASFGIDVALEALRDTLKKRQATVDGIWHYAEICRVARVIYPYLEAFDCAIS